MCAARAGAKLLWGGKELNGGKHTIPKKYGAIEPTAVYVPISEALKDDHFQTVTTEIFGPLTVITDYKDSEKDKVIEACERMNAHLTAAVVSNDIQFVQHMLANTVKRDNICWHACAHYRGAAKSLVWPSW